MLRGNLKTWRTVPELSTYASAFEFLEKFVAEDLPDGRYELPYGYVGVQENELMDPTAERFEAHESYIDIQCVLSGKERMLVTDRSAASVRVPYDAEKDLIWFHHSGKSETLELGPGDFVFFFPENVHHPVCKPADSPETKARKAIVKWPVNIR